MRRTSRPASPKAKLRAGRSASRLDALIEEATVDAYDESEQRAGFFTMLEAFSRLADDGVPVHELQLLAGHASITTTQRYMNARASSLADSMRQARERRVNRVEHADEATAQIG